VTALVEIRDEAYSHEKDGNYDRRCSYCKTGMVHTDQQHQAALMALLSKLSPVTDENTETRVSEK
jgi:hypothetical protein